MALNDLLTAFVLLTRAPVARFARPDRAGDVAGCVWAFPVVGVAVGAAGGLIYWLALSIGMPAVLAATWTVAATMMAAGAFHEDGLADTADGFGGGGPSVRKLEIMRDSRIGSYGALALLLSTMLRIAAIATLASPGLVTIATISAGMLGRSGMILLLMTLRPARNDGLGASVGRPPATSAALGMGIAIVGSLLLLPARPALVAILSGLGACWGIAKLAQAQIGGHTGDVLGASEVVTECVVLTVLASVLGK